MVTILVAFHTIGGRTAAMAEEIADGIRSVADCTALIKRIPDMQPPGPPAPAQGPWRDLPLVTTDDLVACDGLALGTPVHFGSMNASVHHFLDSTGAIWMKRLLIGKPASVFCAAGSGGGRESAILSLWSILGAHGMVLVPLGFREGLGDLSVAHGASPFGAGTVMGPGDRPVANERQLARAQGAALADVAKALKMHRA